uniref:Reticulon-like protein n=1 Tax=Parastrongyloides trichosuri TaxID=131310 RepID=A0A0N5A755_PARTI
MSFSTNAETEILANLGILSNQHLSKKASRKESLNDSKETTNRTRLLSSSDLDKTSLNYDSEDEENMIVFNDLNSGTNNYLIKMSKTNKWQAFIVGSLLILVSSLFDTKVYFLIFLFLTLGGLFAPLAISKSFIHVTSVELKSDRLLSKRETPTFLNSNIVEITTIPSTFNVNLTLNVTGNPLTKISKPDSVIGVSENQDKKTEENGLQRAAAEEKRKKEEEINGTLIKNITPTNIMTTNIVVTTLPSTTKLEYKTSLDTTVAKIETTKKEIITTTYYYKIFFTILSLHLSSYYRQNEIERLTNSLSGSCRKQNSDVSIKIKKSKHGYNRLNNDIDGSFDTLSLIDSDSDASNDEIFN